MIIRVPDVVLDELSSQDDWVSSNHRAFATARTCKVKVVHQSRLQRLDLVGKSESPRRDDEGARSEVHSGPPPHPTELSMRSRNERTDLQETAGSTTSDSDRSADDGQDEIVRRLAERAYHLPGYSWKQDWLQYFCNNHPLFAVCLQHKSHPVNIWMRLVGFIGSVAFGLCVTNVVWLLFFYNQDQTPVFAVSAAGVDLANSTHYKIFNEQDHSAIAQYTRIEFSEGMLVLWTVGGFVHALFDEFVWTLTSCGCCLNHESLEWMQQYRKYANVLVVLLITLVASVASLIVVIRATLSNNSSDVDIATIRSAGLADDTIEISQVKDASNYEFLISYAVELAVAWLVYWPLVETVLFSGFLSCKGTIPSLGGRPFEIAQEEMQKAKKSARRSKDIEHTGLDARYCP